MAELRSIQANCNTTCHKVTTWEGRKTLKCQGCGTPFPCVHKCDHDDCMEARGEENPRLVKREEASVA